MPRYVVYSETYVQDGHEDHAHLFTTLEEALKYINKHANPWGAQNFFQLFELGKEIPLEAYDASVKPEPPPVEVKTQYRLPKKGRKKS